MDNINFDIEKNAGRLYLLSLIKRLRLDYPDFVEIKFFEDNRIAFVGFLGDLILDDDLWEELQEKKVLYLEPVDLKYVFCVLKENK